MLPIILERLTGMQHGKVVDSGQTAGFHVLNEPVLLGNLLHKVERLARHGRDRRKVLGSRLIGAADEGGLEEVEDDAAVVMEEKRASMWVGEATDAARPPSENFPLKPVAAPSVGEVARTSKVRSCCYSEYLLPPT
jgi:hypothetical protein